MTLTPEARNALDRIEHDALCIVRAQREGDDDTSDAIMARAGRAAITGLCTLAEQGLRGRDLDAMIAQTLPGALASHLHQP
jgi:hypothetical protein